MSDESKAPKFRSDHPDFLKAVEYALTLHAGQTRKSTEIPYVSHLFGVASITIEYGADLHEAIGALLHDAAEDCGGLPRLRDIQERFGPAAAEIVNGCTDTFENPKPDWEVRKVKYIAHLEGASPSVRLVSAADKLHNARSILKDFREHKIKVFDRFKKDTPWHTLWYYRRLADAFLRLGGGPLADELDRVVRKIERSVEKAVSPQMLEVRSEVFDKLDAALRKVTI